MPFSDTIVVLASDAPAGLLPARQQMAVSLGCHIVLACFGVAFPAMIYVMHRRGIVRGEPIALRLAKRWSKVSAVLFAIGAVSGSWSCGRFDRSPVGSVLAETRNGFSRTIRDMKIS